MVAEAVLEPSAVLAVIVAVPDEIPVTFPSEATEATFVLLLDQVYFLFEAFDGATEAVRVMLSPGVRLADFLLREMPVTATVFEAAIPDEEPVKSGRITPQ